MRVGVEASLLITNEQSVPIETLKADTLCFEAIHSTSFKIER